GGGGRSAGAEVLRGGRPVGAGPRGAVAPAGGAGRTDEAEDHQDGGGGGPPPEAHAGSRVWAWSTANASAAARVSGPGAGWPTGRPSTASIGWTSRVDDVRKASGV